jgi:hypothetical protein
MKLYEVYDDTECPRCGNTERNRDAGPYDPDPFFDDAMGGPPDPRVHLIYCGGCGKPFDAAPEEVVRASMAGWLHYYSDACPHPACHPGDRPSVTPDHVQEKRGRTLAEYDGPCGHKWVTRWGGRKLDSMWPIERELVTGDARETAAAFAALTQDLMPPSGAA